MYATSNGENVGTVDVQEYEKKMKATQLVLEKLYAKNKDLEKLQATLKTENSGLRTQVEKLKS